MQNMSSDRLKYRSSSSCARRRSTNRPTWFPTLVSVDSRSSSGARISLLKNSSTLCTCPRSRIGNPKAEWSPSRSAMEARGKFGSRTTSGIHTGCPVLQTRPGRPTLCRNVVSRLTRSNSGNASRERRHVSTQRSTSASPSIRQSAPYSQSSASQIACRIFGAASPNVADSTSARAATCSAVSRLVAWASTLDPCASRTMAGFPRDYRPEGRREWKRGEGVPLLPFPLGMRGLLSEGLHELVLPLFHLLRREFLLPGRDCPAVAGRIDERAATIAPELVRHRAHRARWHLTTGLHGAIEQRVGIVNVDPKRDRRTTQSFGSFRAHHRVVGHEARIANPQLCVQDLSVRSDSAAEFLGAESLLVPLDRLRGIVENQLRRDRMKSFRDRALCFCHFLLLSRSGSQLAIVM